MCLLWDVFGSFDISVTIRAENSTGVVSFFHDCFVQLSYHIAALQFHNSI